jgi:hypothetical protein
MGVTRMLALRARDWSANGIAHSKNTQSEEIATSHQPRPPTPNRPALIYELFVLGELIVQPMYGSFLHETASRILGPFRPLSWGIVYPLIRRLEQEGLVTSVVLAGRALHLWDGAIPLGSIRLRPSVGSAS